MANGGARPGAGRKSNAQKLLDRQNALNQIAGWFPPNLQKSVWSDLLNDPDPNVRLNDAKYLCDQMYGKANQALQVSGPDGGPVQSEHRIVFLGVARD